MMKRVLLAALAVAALAGCGNRGGDEISVMGSARQVIGQAIGGAGRGASPAAAPVTPEAMAAEALRVNPGPLILAGLEGAGTTQVLAHVGENGGMRTYMTKNEQALILRGGMLVGTRGLGNDLSVAEGEAANALIRGRRAGEAERILRIYTGDGQETPLRLTCRIAPGADSTVIETCRVGGATVQNRYLVAGDGSIPVSRQWAGPKLGYITIQTLRP